MLLMGENNPAAGNWSRRLGGQVTHQKRKRITEPLADPVCSAGDCRKRGRYALAAEPPVSNKEEPSIKLGNLKTSTGRLSRSGTL